ncbi:MAG TPA: hypothetical protein VLD35_06600 [Caldimonas sp.]|nr:hypothetical protein [Caldimonas sp.]
MIVALLLVVVAAWLAWVLFRDAPPKPPPTRKEVDRIPKSPADE